MAVTEEAPEAPETPESQEALEERIRFGEVVRTYRMARGLSQAEVGKRANVSPGYIGLIETGLRGTKTSYAIIMRISAALALTAEEIIEFMRVAELGAAAAGVITVGDVIPFDPTLSDEQKTAFLALYMAFRSESASSTG